jgi:peptide subunit release factor RF-3
MLWNFRNDPCECVMYFLLVSHAEWMLYEERVITQKPATASNHKDSSSSLLLDSDPVEATRHSSVFSHFMRIPHCNFLLEIADTPFGEFPSDVFATLDGADSAVLVVSAADGVDWDGECLSAL